MRHAVLGVLSLIFWSLLSVVTLKYIVRDLALRQRRRRRHAVAARPRQQKFGTVGTWAARFVALAALGTAMFYCEALITPAITVLSAVEGLELLDPGFERIVLPITLGIIVALFAFQRRGTARVGGLFGPIMVLWFGTLAALGVVEIVDAPEVLVAVSPSYAVSAARHAPRPSR